MAPALHPPASGGSLNAASSSARWYSGSHEYLANTGGRMELGNN